MAPDDCDALIIQRPTSAELARAIPFLRAKGIAVVCDFDDDLSSIDPSNFAFDVHHPTRDPSNHWRWAEQACRDATLVTVSTPALAAKYGGHGRVRVLRNCVPDHYLDVTPPTRLDGFGWAGNVHTHPRDLQVLGPAAAKLIRAGHPFTVIGPSPELVGRALGLDEEPVATGSVGFGAWPYQVAQLGVGIAPLASTTFNVQKSAWKLLEMSAVGVPWVASDTPEYRRLAAYGSIVSRPREWTRELSSLLNDEGLRTERAERGREAARTMTYSAHAHEWMEAWEDAIALQRASVLR